MSSKRKLRYGMAVGGAQNAFMGASKLMAANVEFALNKTPSDAAISENKQPKRIPTHEY